MLTNTLSLNCCLKQISPEYLGLKKLSNYEKEEKPFRYHGNEGREKEPQKEVEPKAKSRCIGKKEGE